jgi:all-trans-8'-apo-beta-carotenal 15,15'-oxygenase
MTEPGVVEDDHCPLLERAFEATPVEGAYAVDDVEGLIPAFLAGTYYLNGPCRFQVGDQRYRHWLDGDGMVSSLRFEEGRAFFRNRFVRGAKWRDEEQAGRALYRTFGTAFQGDRLKRGLGLESPLNVSVYPWSGTLLAFGEQGLPWELDPETLESRGEFNFGGRLNAISPVSAHPHCNGATGEMFNFGVSFSARQPSLTVYRFGADGELVYRKRHALEWPAAIHDFLLGPRHVVFYVAPYLLDVDALIAGGRTLMESLSWQPERGARLLVLDRETGEHVHQVTLPAPGRYCLHLINCFEENGRLHVDLIEIDRPVYDQYQVVPDLFRDAPAGRPRRHVVDLASGILVESVELPAFASSPDFPAIDPRHLQRAYDDFWLLGISAAAPGRKFFDQLLHLRWSQQEPQVWPAPAGHYLGGEPVFLGHPERDDRGCVLIQDFDAERRTSAFLLFDAFDIESGPLARLPLRHPIPPCFHAAWHPDV